jgi:feruloyl esterase
MEELSGDGATEYGETYFFTQPRFETGDPRYAWLNSVVAVAQGKVGPQRVDYRLYQLR